MKPIAAIVETAPDLAAEQVIVWREEERHAETSAARLEQQAGAARATAATRRLQIGELLVKQREKWPLSGPRARGWGEWLAKAKLDDSTAWRYMDAWKNRNVSTGDDDVGDPSQSPDLRGNGRDTKPANVHGGSGDPRRGKFCTPEKYAAAVGSWDLDPFSNPSSHIVSTERCMLEDGGDGFGDGKTPGSYRIGQAGGYSTEGRMQTAGANTRTWLQPDYGRGVVERVVAHYGHTRFCALLRFAPETGWFTALWPRVAAIAIPRERLPFETPDGVQLAGADESEDRGAPFPHVLYYADERDITPAIRELCIVLRVDHPNT